MQLNEVEFNYGKLKGAIYSRNSIEIVAKLMYKDERKILLRNRESRITFKVDTGASTTIIPANAIGIADNEDEFKTIYDYTEDDKSIAEGINSVKVGYYTIWLNSFIIGNIEILAFPIAITFEPNFTTPLLGMDLIGLFNIYINIENRTIKFKETKELAKYTHNNRELEYPIIVNNQGIKLDLLDLEANYIHNKSKSKE